MTTLVVTALYKVPSKFSFDQYIQWATLFLQTIQGPVVCFCEADVKTQLPKRPNVSYEILAFADFQATKK